MRREILLVGQVEDFDKFEFLTQAYIRHYRGSVYAADFWQRLSTVLSRSSFALEERRFVRIATLLEQVDRATRLKLLLVIGKKALVNGRLAVVHRAGEQALSLAEDTAERERAHFFVARRGRSPTNMRPGLRS